MELREALTQISEIRDQIARAETFDGYRSATVGFSGVLALGAAAVQPLWISDPVNQLPAYLCLWVSVAAVSAAIAGAEIVVRCRRSASETSVRLSRMAVEQFLPAVVAGALVTAVIARLAPEAAWMLPGLWSVLYGLGVFSSARLLPRPVFWVASYFVVAGALCLAAAKGVTALAPWSMALTFGAGQLIAAGVLYFSLERGHGQRR
jgi:hypothetical protein